VSGNSIHSLVGRRQVIPKPFDLPFERMPTNVNHIECHVYDGSDAIMLVFFAAHLCFIFIFLVVSCFAIGILQTKMQSYFTQEPVWYTLSSPFYNVVGIRRPADGADTKQLMFLDRGRVEFQKFGASDNKFRIVCFERGTGDILLIIPVDYIRHGAGKFIKSKDNKLKKTKVFLDLNAKLSTNIDGLEQITLKLDRDEANRLADLLVPSWIIMKGFFLG
jgi:hypothetical protein